MEKTGILMLLMSSVIYVIIFQSNAKDPFSTSTVHLIKPQHYLEVQDSGHGEPRDLE